MQDAGTLSLRVRARGERGSRRLIAAGVIATALLTVPGCDHSEKASDPKPRGALDSITIGTTPYAGLALLYVALANGYFENEGLKVAVRSFPAGKLALDAVLGGSIDVATVADLPVAVAALRGQPVAVFATLASGENDYAVVGRIDKGVSRPAALRGKRVAVTFGTSGDFFLDALLLRQKLSRADVRALNRKPEEMADALANGEADAVSTWEPYVSEARRRFGDNAFVLYSGGIYDSMFNLAATRDFVTKRGDTVRKLLRALVRAEEFYVSDRAAAERIVAESLKIGPSEAREYLAKHRFSLSLDQSLVLMMEDESRWAIKSKLVEAKATPNLLNNIYLNGLLEVKPKAVTVVH